MTSYDPRAAFHYVNEYDIEKGYARLRYASMCKEPHVVNNLDRLKRYGFEVVPVFSDGKWFEKLSFQNEVYANDIGKETLFDVMDNVFNTALTRKIDEYFFSNWVPIFFAVFASAEETASLKWHFDAGPAGHLKILIYLNETNGRTEFIDRAASDLFKRWGYAHPKISYRVDDLGELDTGISYKVRAIQPLPGEGILFEPNGCLHKGVFPTKGTRWVMQIGMVPWPVPWRREYDKVYGLIENNEGAGFPAIVM